MVVYIDVYRYTFTDFSKFNPYWSTLAHTLILESTWTPLFSLCCLICSLLMCISALFYQFSIFHSHVSTLAHIPLTSDRLEHHFFVFSEWFAVEWCVYWCFLPPFHEFNPHASTFASTLNLKLTRTLLFWLQWVIRCRMKCISALFYQLSIFNPYLSTLAHIPLTSDRLEHPFFVFSEWFAVDRGVSRCLSTNFSEI